MDPAILGLIVLGEQLAARWLVQKQPPTDAEMQQLAQASGLARQAAEARAESLKGPADDATLAGQVGVKDAAGWTGEGGA